MPGSEHIEKNESKTIRLCVNNKVQGYALAERTNYQYDCFSSKINTKKYLSRQRRWCVRASLCNSWLPSALPLPADQQTSRPAVFIQNIAHK